MYKRLNPELNKTGTIFTEQEVGELCTFLSNIEHSLMISILKATLTMFTYSTFTYRWKVLMYSYAISSFCFYFLFLR